jgi:hypothetical protein
MRELVPSLGGGSDVGHVLTICYRPDSVEGRQCCAYSGAGVEDEFRGLDKK